MEVRDASAPIKVEGSGCQGSQSSEVWIKATNASKGVACGGKGEITESPDNLLFSVSSKAVPSRKYLAFGVLQENTRWR